MVPTIERPDNTKSGYFRGILNSFWQSGIRFSDPYCVLDTNLNLLTNS